MLSGTWCDSWACPVQGQELNCDDSCESFQIRIFYDSMNIQHHTVPFRFWNTQLFHCRTQSMHSVCSGCALMKPTCKTLITFKEKILQDVLNVWPINTHLWYIWDCRRYIWTVEGEKWKNPLLISFLLKILILAFQHISNTLESVKWKVKGTFYFACDKIKPN